MSDFAVQKPMHTVSLSFGSSSEAVVTRLIDWPKHCVSIFQETKPKQKIRVQTPCSLFTFTTCYQSLQTVWIQKMVRRAWSGANMHTKSYNLVLFGSNDHHTLKGTFQKVPSFRCMPCADPEGGQAVRTPLKNHWNIGFPSNIDPDPLNITKLPSQHSMVGHYRQWRFADEPMVVHF